MAELRLEIVTPTGRVLDVMAGEVRAPGAAGELGILPQHRPGLIKLSGGAVAWTGAAAAYVFGLPLRRSLPAIVLGVCLAGLVVSLAWAAGIGVFTKLPL